MPVRKSPNLGWTRVRLRLSDGMRSRHGGRSNQKRSVPASVWIAPAAAVVVAMGFVLVGPLKDPSKFYEIAAQIMPAFLIAVAVERSTLSSLGTKADFARVRREETVDSYSPRGMNEGVRNTIEFAFLARTQAVLKPDLEMLGIPVEPVDVAKAAVVGNWDDDSMFWWIFRGVLHDEFGLPADDPDYFDPPDEWTDPSPAFKALRESALSREPGEAVRLLAAHAALRQDREFAGGKVGIQIVGAELSRLFAAQRDAVLKGVLSRVTYRANREYDRQLSQRTLSLGVAIVLLTTTELLALIGLISPGRPYSGLFVVTAAAVGASIMNVGGGALADLASRRGR